MKRHSVSARPRASRAAVFFGSVSMAALAAAPSLAQPQTAQAPVEEVLVTGSLIRGAAAVGVPVTALSAESFRETGSLTITELLRNTPALQVAQDSSPSQGGGRLSGVVNVQIHGLGTGAGNEALLMVEHLRIPPQNYSLDTMDPSIIPQISIQRIDVLTAGASAEYGSDATAGVINIILKRNFDGAITQLNYRTSQDLGNLNIQAGQLYGRTWDGGDIAIGYQYTENQHFSAIERPYYTTNFEKYGLQDQTPLASSMPAVITTGSRANVTALPPGATAATGTRYCANCFKLPHGVGWDADTRAPGPTTSWAAIQANAFVPLSANTQNQVDTWKYAWGSPDRGINQATLTFDQKLTDDLMGMGPVTLFVDAFYSNRRAKIIWQANGGDARNALIANQVVPTTNPFYPTGAPAGLRVNYFLGAEIPQIAVGGEVDGRYSGGVSFDELPFEWSGRLTWAKTEVQAYGKTPNNINVNNVAAALGNTVASQAAKGSIPGQAAYTKPANVPFLNPFCDSDVFRCISPATAAYITGFRNQQSRYAIQQTQLNLDGLVLDLPGGKLRTGILVESTAHRFVYRETTNARNHSNALISDDTNPYKERVWAAAVQVNVPIIGEGNAFPGVESFVLEGGYRYDRYTTLDENVWTPKISANWVVGNGLTIRGSYGTAFRAPNPAEENGPLFTAVSTLNILGGQESVNSNLLNCAPFTGSDQFAKNAAGALIGSLTEKLNPTCSTDPTLAAPAGVLVGGSGTGAAQILRGHGLEPQTLDQWYVGFNYAPMEGFLQGLTLDAQYFVLYFKNLIGDGFPGTGPNDPRSLERFTFIPNPAAPITDPSNASFFELVNELSGLATRGGEGGIPTSLIPSIKFIRDTANSNIGWRRLQGIDFSGRYDWDMGELGSWNVGVEGYYEVNNRQRNTPTAAVSETYQGQHSGNRLKRVRYRLGWTDGEWSITAFARYTGHGSINTNGTNAGGILTCYYLTGFGPGSCYPGSPYYGPLTTFPNFSPAQVEGDLTIGYQTGDRPASPYLQNLNLQLSINNFLNRKPPFQVGLRGSLRDGRAFDNAFSDQQRVISVSLTKNW